MDKFLEDYTNQIEVDMATIHHISERKRFDVAKKKAALFCLLFTAICYASMVAYSIVR